MFGHLRTLVVSLLVVSSPALVITPALPQAAAVPTDFTAVVRQKMPAVVAILTKQMIEDEARGVPDDLPFGELFRRRFREPRAQARTALGSGFIVSSRATS